MLAPLRSTFDALLETYMIKLAVDLLAKKGKETIYTPEIQHGTWK